MLRKNFISLFVLAVVVIPFAAFTAVQWYESTYTKLPVYGGDDHTISDFKMINQQGETVSIKNWVNKIVVVDFFFTHCPSVCPKMTKNLVVVQQQFKDDPHFQMASFSVDPERDSSKRLAFYATQFGINGANWNLLTGDKKEIYRLARKSFLVSATDGDGGPNDFIHSDQLVLVDTQKRIRGFYDGTEKSAVAQLINDIKKLQKEEALN